MAGLLGFARLLGGVLRFNILHAEDPPDAGGDGGGGHQRLQRSHAGAAKGASSPGLARRWSKWSSHRVLAAACIVSVT